MPPALSLCASEVMTSVVPSKVSFCAKHRAGPWKIKKQTGHFGRAGTCCIAGRERALSLLSQAYFCFSKASKVTNEHRSPTFGPTAANAFSPGSRKGNLLAFQASHQDERGV